VNLPSALPIAGEAMRSRTGPTHSLEPPSQLFARGIERRTRAAGRPRSHSRLRHQGPDGVSATDERNLERSTMPTSGHRTAALRKDVAPEKFEAPLKQARPAVDTLLKLTSSRLGLDPVPRVNRDRTRSAGLKFGIAGTPALKLTAE
jgi:hypothetical protein